MASPAEPLSTRHRRLFAYEQDSHARVLAALAAVPPQHQGRAEYAQALELFAHLVAARRLWLARLGRAPAPADGLFPGPLAPAELASRLAEMNALWTGYLAELGDAEVQRAFVYESLDAGRFRNTVDEVLTQLHGHSLYHRGQIASRLKALGCTPPATDFIYWARVAVE